MFFFVFLFVGISSKTRFCYVNLEVALIIFAYIFFFQKDVLESILKKATEQNNVLFASVSDHFELCLAKCRTNSQSVQHENSYKDPKSKHCYGETAPTTNSLEEV